MHGKPACKEVSAGAYLQQECNPKDIVLKHAIDLHVREFTLTTAQGKFQIKDPVRSRDLQSTGAVPRSGGNDVNQLGRYILGLFHLKGTNPFL